MHLYVTPSHLVLITGAVILGIVGLIALIIAVLHLKEKVRAINYSIWTNKLPGITGITSNILLKDM